MRIEQGIVALLLAVSVTACGAGEQANQQGNFSSDPEQAKIERVVHDYILNHAEVIEEAFKRQDEQAKAKLAEDMRKEVQKNRKGIETPFEAAWAGNKDGDVVLVEFFDYACGYCRASNADIDRLLAEDKNLKVVWREWPVLSEDSHEAAKASLAAAQQGRFVEFHKQLFAAGAPSATSVAKVQAAIGVKPLTSPKFDAEIEKNYDLTRALKGTGTPLFVVGDKVLHGAVGYDVLKEAIADARKKKA